MLHVSNCNIVLWIWTIILCDNSIKVRSSTNWGRLRHWLKGQNSRVLKVNILQQQTRSATPLCRPLFKSLFTVSFHTTTAQTFPYMTAHSFGQRCVFVLEMQVALHGSETNVSLRLYLSPCLMYSKFATLAQGIQHNTHWQCPRPLPALTVTFLCCPTHTHTLVLVRGGATSTVGYFLLPSLCSSLSTEVTGT